MADFDVIIVPGGGVRAGGELPPWVRNRLDYVQAHHAGEPVLCLSAGTTHRPPPLNAQGFPIFESVAATKYLAARGITPDLLFSETCSYDTIGNAYYARTIHTDVQGWRTAQVITSAFHSARTEFIFRWVFGLDSNAKKTLQHWSSTCEVPPHPPAEAASLIPPGERGKLSSSKQALLDTLDYDLTFVSVPDVGMPADVLAARYQREQASLERVRGIAAGITDMAALHHWLHTQHGAYAVGEEPLRADSTVAGSY